MANVYLESKFMYQIFLLGVWMCSILQAYLPRFPALCNAATRDV